MVYAAKGSAALKSNRVSNMHDMIKNSLEQLPRGRAKGALASGSRSG